ncbi:formyltransferase family protein [Paenibacillus eucommiae]|uniref:Methionyl-tRNA formyltransferase n=1 Tax=Paenibacillus eucommiae TaxID=1355755 RepID=A0ABS4J3W0_9BACL|nr:formyltransferase family protein [Paenibacillus eucommiae]MBP1993970.1 methionyl-tRNA formyltransferase [Paenibacillus eucommiae]
MNYRITIVTDKNNWINTYMPQWIEALEPSTREVDWVHDAAQMKHGDIAFYLGCEQIVTRQQLDLHTHNLVVHASDLPQGKGWSPLTWKILQGEHRIPVVLFEAAEQVDSGPVYLKHTMEFAGHELLGELRAVLAATTLKLCSEFIGRYPAIVKEAQEQQGEASFYPKRTPQDSRLNPESSIQEQFALFRVADNERYPCFFELGGETYILKIEKKG